MPRDRRCVAFGEAPYRAARDGLGILLRAGKARRDMADLTGDVAAAKIGESDDPAVRRHRRTEVALRALVLAKLSPPRYVIAPALGPDCIPTPRDLWAGRAVQRGDRLGRLHPLEGPGDGSRLATFDGAKGGAPGRRGLQDAQP